MDTILNLIILIFEIFYYSLFMYFSKREGKLWRYILLFTLITEIGMIIGTNYIGSYLLLILMILMGMKLLVTKNTKLYDMLIIVLMMFVKIMIEMCYYIVLHNELDIYTIGICYSLVKVLLPIIFKEKLKNIYDKLNSLWKNNNFHVRYIFSILMFIYCIATCVFIIFYYLGK